MASDAPEQWPIERSNAVRTVVEDGEDSWDKSSGSLISHGGSSAGSLSRQSRSSGQRSVEIGIEISFASPAVQVFVGRACALPGQCSCRILLEREHKRRNRKRDSHADAFRSSPCGLCFMPAELAHLQHARDLASVICAGRARGRQCRRRHGVRYRGWRVARRRQHGHVHRVALDIIRRDKQKTSIHELERYMRCKNCSQERGCP